MMFLTSLPSFHENLEEQNAESSHQFVFSNQVTARNSDSQRHASLSCILYHCFPHFLEFAFFVSAQTVINNVCLRFYSCFPQSVIVLGALIFVIAFLGCCGAIIESHCILLTFGIIVTVILALELTIAGLAFAFKSDLNSVTNRELKDAIQKFNWTDPNSRYSVFWNQMQGSLKCCGYNSSSDWPETNPNPNDRNVIPDSCCPRAHVNETSATVSNNNLWTVDYGKESGNCRVSNFYASNFDSGSSGFNRGFGSSFEATTSSSQQQSGPFRTGCAEVLVDTLLKLVAPLGLACLAIALFQVLGIIFAFSLSKAVRRDYQVV